MNFPKEVFISTANVGSSGSNNIIEENTTSNKSNTYDKAGKRGTRLVRSV